MNGPEADESSGGSAATETSATIECPNLSQFVGQELSKSDRPELASAKGQLISKCPYEKSVSSKIPTKIFLEFCPEIFCSFLGASWKLFGLPGDLVSNIINKEGYWKPKKLPGSPQKATKNFRAEIRKYFRWYFWMKLIFHKDILKLTDLLVERVENSIFEVVLNF